MKFLKKASLAASIAAVSFAANAELVAMDEAMMSAATGQAGIDLDITLAYDANEPALSIGEILYRDTDTQGGVAITNLTLSSATGSDITLTNAIDITAGGDIEIVSGDVSGLHLHIDRVDTVASTYELGGTKAANLVGTTDLYMNLTGGTTTITQNGSDTQIQMRGGAVEVVSGVDLDNADGDNDLTTGVENSSSSLLNGAITLGELQIYGTDGVGSGISTQADVTLNGNGVTIDNLNLAGTIKIGQLDLGAGQEVGSLEISNIALNGASVTISGR